MNNLENLNKIAKEIYEGNKLRGFDVSKENIGQTLMLVVSELAEALEADRKNKHANIKMYEHLVKQTSNYKREDYKKEQDSFYFRNHIKDTFEDEIADSFIRLFDLCGGLKIDIEKHIKYKLEYNSKREFRHGKRY